VPFFHPAGSTRALHYLLRCKVVLGRASVIATLSGTISPLLVSRGGRTRSAACVNRSHSDGRSLTQVNLVRAIAAMRFRY